MLIRRNDFGYDNYEDERRFDNANEPKALQQMYIQDQADRDFLKRESYFDIMKQEKQEILLNLKEAKVMKRKMLEFNREQDEQFELIEDQTRTILKNMKKTNKELAQAYMYDTKNGTSKITAGTTGKDFLDLI
jgi:hypothetical protein